MVGNVSVSEEGLQGGVKAAPSSKEVRLAGKKCKLTVANINALLPLIENLESNVKMRYLEDSVLFALLSTVSEVLVYYAKQGYFDSKLETSSSKGKVSVWIRVRLQNFVRSCLHYLEFSDEPAIQVESFKCLLETLLIESGLFDEGHETLFANHLYQQVVASVLRTISQSKCWNEPISTCISDSLKKYEDLKFYFFKDFDVEAFRDSSRDAVIALYQFLADIGPPNLQRADSPLLFIAARNKKGGNEGGPVSQRSSHRKHFSHCMLQFLRLPLPSVVHSHILQNAHSNIIPYMSQPAHLCDYFADSFSQGGLSSLLSLQGLWTLMRDYKLEYPDFYAKLYTMLSNNLAHVQFRSRFLRLCDMFLSSTHIPAYVVASFAKKLSRLSLYAPPSASVAILALVYNLFKRHPVILCLIHRPDDDPLMNTTGADPFDPEAPLCKENGAMESSLWEIVTLQKHYRQSVRRMALVFNQVLTTQEFKLEDFLDLSHEALLT